MVTPTKRCTNCWIIKPTVKFSKDCRRPSGLQSWCKECRNESSRKYYLSKQGSTYNRRKHLKTRFNITLEQYDKMLEDQKEVCMICGGTNADGRRLYVDHDHETGKIRGLLCFSCNRLLGDALDDVKILKNATQYLRKYSDVK